MYKVGSSLHLYASPSDFSLSCTSKAYYVLDTVLNTLSHFSEQAFEAGNCCEGEETELRTSDLQSQGTEPRHTLLAVLSFF